MASATAAVSGGHLNPAVTFGILLARKIDLPNAIGYIVSQCLGGIAAAVLTEDPKSILEHCPDLNPELADLVMSTLAKDREERFESAQAFQHALDSIDLFPGKVQ